MYANFVDSRDSYSYATILANGLYWFADNLKTKVDRDGNQINRYCYNNIEDNCETDGGFYDIEVSDEVCPEGWRLATDEDWRNLEAFFGVDPEDYDDIVVNEEERTGPVTDVGSSAVIRNKLIDILQIDLIGLHAYGRADEWYFDAANGLVIYYAEPYRRVFDKTGPNIQIGYLNPDFDRFSPADRFPIRCVKTKE